MNQNKRCWIESHEQFYVNQVCTYRWCDMNRWCCSQCVIDDIHLHYMPNSNHIKNQASLCDKVKKDIEKLKIEFFDSKQAIQIKTLLSQLVIETLELEKLVTELRQNLQKQLKNLISDDDNLELESLMQKAERQSFMQMSDDELKQLLRINLYQFNCDVFQQFQDPLDRIQQQQDILQQKVQEHQKKKNHTIINFRQREYDIQKIYEVYVSYASSLISKNEQYLVYNYLNHLHIYNIKMNKAMKRIKYQNNLSSFQFTNDSKILFAGDQEGFVSGCSLQNGFKRFFKQKIHEKGLTQIIIQQQYLITAANDATIIKTDYTNKNKIFTLVGHTSSIISIDYNNQKDIIISSSNNQSIKVWDCLNQCMLIDYTNQRLFFTQIQFISNSQDILCNTQVGILKFEIDYENKKLLKSEYYSDWNIILGFYQVNNYQNLLLICKYCCIILNKEGEQIYVTQHNRDLSKQMYQDYRYQLDNLNYIILQDCKLLYYQQDQQLYLLRVKENN